MGRHPLGSFLGVIRNRSPYLEGRERPKKRQITQSGKVVGLISKGTDSPGLSWAAARPDFCTLEVYMEAFPGVSPT